MSRGSNNWGIYIGNIPRSLSKEHVEGLFMKFNIVEASDIHHNGTKTFCFMKLRGGDDVTNAVAEMNNHNVNGRKLQVRRFENKQRSGKQEKELNNGDNRSSLSTVEDAPPPLETPFTSKNNFDTCLNQKSRTHYYSNDKLQPSHYGDQKSSNSRLSLCTSPQASGYSRHTPTHNNSHMSPQAQNSGFNNVYNQFNETSDISPVKTNTLHSPSCLQSQLSPQSKNTQLRSADQGKEPSSLNRSTLSQQSDRSSHFSADHDQSSSELPEKYRYVHSTRNVISYNPRDLQNNKMKFNSREYSSSEAVKVWAANFPFGTTKNQMMKLFEDFSPLKVCININAPGGDFTRATITLPSLDAAEAAIMELDNTIFRRRTLLVGLVEEGDEFADDYDEEVYDGEEGDEYGDPDAGYYYYEPYDYSEQDYYHRSRNDEQFYYEEPVSRRLHDMHLS